MNINQALEAMRNKAPLVHCITNYVAMNIAANVTLASGASPAMIHAPEEVSDFVPIAGALTINIGTLSEPWAQAMHKAAQAANEANVPWVLDPVAHFATPYRAGVTKELIARTPSIIKGNASEIIALAGQNGSGKGVDSGDSVDNAQAAAIDLAKRHNCVIAVTGTKDFVTNGATHADICGGARIMPKVTALGCSITALVGAYSAVCDPLDAAIAALTHFAQAGETAGKTTNAPASFQLALIDELYRIQPGDLDQARVQWR